MDRQADTNRQTDSSVDYGVSARSRLPTLSTASVLENQHFPSDLALHKEQNDEAESIRTGQSFA